MNVEIGAEAALFPEKEYINEISVAVYLTQGNLVDFPLSTMRIWSQNQNG